MSETSLVKTDTNMPTRFEETQVPTIMPAADLIQTGEGYRLVVDLPGVDPNCLEVHLESGVLSLTAQPSAEDEEGWESLYGHVEARRYHRTFPLGDEVDGEHIQAQMEAGVLTVELPRSATLGRRIAVSTG